MLTKVSDYIFDYLVKNTGVDTVFMLPGGGCMHLVDSLGKTPGLRYVCNLHEQASVIAAESYAQDRNSLGVALVTAGPGSTNAITGVAGAWIDSTPLLVLSGQAKVEDMMTGKGIRQMGIQEVDTEAIVRPITKYAKCVKNANDIPFELEKAVWLATNGRRGPVWLDLPLDVQGATIEPDALPHFKPETEMEYDYAKAANEILGFLKQAKRPCIYAGNGVRASGALAHFIELVEKLQIPVMTSWKAADFLPEEHPLFVGRPGIVAQRGANFVQQTCDCLLIIGTRLDLCQVGFNPEHFAPRAIRLMVDIDGHEIDKYGESFATKEYPIDAGKLIQAMLNANPSVLNCASFLKKAKEWQRKYPVILPEYLDENKPLVNIYHFTKVLGDLLGKGDLLVPGSSGACAEVTMQAIQVRNGLRIHNTPGLGSMGFGLPASIGGAIASGKRTVCVIGDGGLQHNIQELETLHRLQLDLKLFVFNNDGYGSIRNMQKGRFAGHFVACNPVSGLTLPDLNRIADAYQLPYVKIALPLELQKQVNDVLAMKGPVICEVMLDPEVGTAPRLASEVLPDGRMRSKPMEELAPFLPEEELADILRIE